MEVGTPGKELHDEIQRQAVEVDPEQLAGPRVPVLHQGQRRQEVLAELAVSVPGRPFGPPFEGERVDEHRLSVAELDVVGTGVPQGHAELKGPPLDRKRGERRVPELGGTPLVRVGHERDGLGSEHLVGIRRGGQVGAHFLVRDQQSRGHEVLAEPRLDELVELRLEGPVDLPVENAVSTEQESARISERARQDRDRHRSRSGGMGA